VATLMKGISKKTDYPLLYASNQWTREYIHMCNCSDACKPDLKMIALTQQVIDVYCCIIYSTRPISYVCQAYFCILKLCKATPIHTLVSSHLPTCKIWNPSLWELLLLFQVYVKDRNTLIEQSVKKLHQCIMLDYTSTTKVAH